MASTTPSLATDGTPVGQPTQRQKWVAALSTLLVVLLAHWWTLGEIVALIGPRSEPLLPPSEITRPLLTRTITLPAEVPAVPPSPATAPAAPAPKSRETPSPAPADLAHAVERSAAVVEAVPMPVPAPVAVAASDLQEPPLPPQPQQAPEPPVPVPMPLAAASAPATKVADSPPAAPPPPAEPVPAPVALAPPPAAAAAPVPASPGRLLVWPGSRVLTYQLEVNSFPLPARAELRWRHDGAQYEASLALQSLISVVRTSKGAITPVGLEPLRYGEKITARSETAVHFQHDKGIVSFSNNKPSVALLAGMQDEVSVFFQVAAMLGGSPQHFVAGTEIPLQTAESRAVRSMVFVVGKSEVVDLPGGRVPTVYLSHAEPPAYEGAKSSKGEIWAAPGLDYLPVHIRITEPSGTTYDLRWSQTLAP